MMIRDSFLFVCNQCLIFIIQQTLKEKALMRTYLRLSPSSASTALSPIDIYCPLVEDKCERPFLPEDLHASLKSLLRGFLQRVKLLMLKGMLDSAGCKLIRL